MKKGERKYGKLCAVMDCGRPHFCRSFCKLHYDRTVRLGSPTAVVIKFAPRGEPMMWLRKHASYAGSECLIWPFARFPDGRAHMNGKIPTRVMCELAHGKPPSRGHEAAHSCGRGHDACVNPQHLRWATSKENSADKVAHGTLLRGSRLRHAKLTEADVLAIRALSSHTPQNVIATQFGVKPNCISKIVRHLTWAHVE